MVAPVDMRRSALPPETFGETPPALKFSAQCGRFCGSIFPWREAAIKTPTRWPPLLKQAGFLAFGGNQSERFPQAKKILSETQFCRKSEKPRTSLSF